VIRGNSIFVVHIQHLNAQLQSGSLRNENHCIIRSFVQ